MNFETLFFFLTAATAVVSALFMITRRNPIVSVMFLIVNFFCLAILYLTLQAQFIAVIQILVYAGAIMVLFLFVIMLLSLGNEEKLEEKKSFMKYVAIIAVGAMFVEIAIAVLSGSHAGMRVLPASAAQMGTVEAIGKSLFTQYLFPFEVTSLLLLAAMVGVIVLAKKKFE
jgi:NADH-quinone oxidoreductase subunit J